MKIALFADIHYATADVGTQHKTLALTWIARSMARLATFNPDLIGLLGDSANGDESTSAAEVTYLQSVFAAIGAGSRFAAVGNHEFDNASLAAVTSAFDAGLLLRFVSGKLYGSFDIDGVHIVLLDSSYEAASPYQHFSGAFPGAPGGLIPDGSAGSDDELGWLAADLDAHAAIPTLVFLHSGVGNIDVTDAPYFGPNGTMSEAWGFVANRAAVRSVLESHGNVVAVFSGHQHWNAASVNNGIHYFQIPSLTDLVDRVSGNMGVHAEITVGSGSLAVEIWEDDSISGFSRVISYGVTSGTFALPSFNSTPIMAVPNLTGLQQGSISLPTFNPTPLFELSSLAASINNGGLGIRSPSGAFLTLRTIAGQPLTPRRYANGSWQ